MKAHWARAAGWEPVGGEYGEWQWAAREMVDEWRTLAEMGGPMRAFMASAVLGWLGLNMFEEGVERAAPELAAELRWADGPEERLRWLSMLAARDPLRGLRMALAGRLLAERERWREAGERHEAAVVDELLVATVDGWQALDAMPWQAATVMTAGMLSDVPVDSIYAAARRQLRSGLDWSADGWDRREWSRWLERLSREDGVRAVRIAAEACVWTQLRLLFAEGRQN